MKKILLLCFGLLLSLFSITMASTKPVSKFDFNENENHKNDFTETLVSTQSLSINSNYEFDYVDLLMINSRQEFKLLKVNHIESFVTEPRTSNIFIFDVGWIKSNLIKLNKQKPSTYSIQQIRWCRQKVFSC